MWNNAPRLQGPKKLIHTNYFNRQTPPKSRFLALKGRQGIKYLQKWGLVGMVLALFS
jgi:hypothetical protein